MNKEQAKKHLGINEHQWYKLLLMYKAGYATTKMMRSVNESSLLQVVVGLIRSGANYERIKSSFINSIKHEAVYT
jgi:hypothetical protein